MNAAPVRRRFVAGVLVRDGRVLLCRRRADRPWYPGVWDLPGGHVERGEGLHEALARELAEELEIVVQKATARLETEIVQAQLTVFVVSEWAGEPVNAAPEEHELVCWFTGEEAAFLDLADDRLAELLAEVVRETAES